MFKKITRTTAGAFSSSAMETETISKNRVSPKNVKSRNKFFRAILPVVMAAMVAVCLNSCDKDENKDESNSSLAGTGWRWTMQQMGSVSLDIELDFTNEEEGRIKQVVNGQTIGNGTKFTYDYYYNYKSKTRYGMLYWSSKEYEFTVSDKTLRFEEDAIIGDLYLGGAIFVKK